MRKPPSTLKLKNLIIDIDPEPLFAEEYLTLWDDGENTPFHLNRRQVASLIGFVQKHENYREQKKAEKLCLNSDDRHWGDRAI